MEFKDTLEELTMLEDGRIRITVKTTATMGKFFVISKEAAEQICQDLPSLIKAGGTRKYDYKNKIGV